MPTNTIITNSMIANEALMQVENNLVLGNLVNRDYEKEFRKETNGYKPGNTVSIRRPPKYTLRTGASMAVQDSQEGTVPLVVSTQIGVDLGGWTSADRTLKMSNFADRFLKSACMTIAQGVDAAVAGLYKDVWNWVGTPGTQLTTFAGFAKAPQRLDEMAVMQGDRSAILSPADQWGMIGSVSQMYNNDSAKTALQKARLPMLGNIDTYMSQNSPQHTTGTKAGTPLVNGASQDVAYSAVKDSYQQTLITDGWTNSTAALKQGDVFTIAGVYAVNPVPGATGSSKAVQSYLQQFVVKANGTADGSGNLTVTISPPIIASGAYQTVSAAPADNAAITVMGSASTTYGQNIAFHKNAFALAVVPMDKPEGAVSVERATHNGLSIRMIPVYTGSDDTSAWRLDMLLGVKAIYPDLATRFNGS